jgi:D-alanyl-D-alanine carboxypeptidase/Type IV secretion system pilin
MKVFTLTFGLILIVQFFVVAGVVSAETTTGGIAQLSGCSGPDCTSCNVVDMLNGFIKWIIGFMLILCAVLVTVAGVRLVTSGGNSHTLDEAKGMLTNAIIGLIIIMAAWLMIDTLMRALIGPDGKISNGGDVSGWLYWSEVQCQVVRIPTYNKNNTLTLQYQSYIENGLLGLDGWTISGSSGSSVPTSACTVSGYSGGTPTYDCSAQISQCEINGGGSASVSSDDKTVTCTPNRDVTLETGGGGSCSGITASDLKTVPGTSFQNRISIVDSFVAMRTAAAAAGIYLTISSAYRTDAYQVDIWERHHCDTVADHCRGYVARPCSKGGNGSNHSQGNAFDINGSHIGSATYNWLKANGGRFGFYNNLGAIDSVHWSPSGR